MIDIEIPGRDFDYKVTAKEAAAKILKDIGGIDNSNERECAKCIEYMMHEFSARANNISILVLYRDQRGDQYAMNYNKETDNVDSYLLFSKKSRMPHATSDCSYRIENMPN